MSERKNPRGRSLSGDLEDSELESHEGDPSSNPGKPGRKKNPNSQSARRDQNRIAQREFRLRKQQRIRDLEARVEILSGGHDEALTEMRNILKDLMAENQTLRGLVRSLASFIGEGAGGLLPKLGWDTMDFNNFINRSETDTAWESFQRRKKQQPAQSSGSTPFPGQASKRAADEDGGTNPAKKLRSMDARGVDGERSQNQNGYPLLVPVETGIPSTVYPSPRPPGSQASGTIFSDLMRNGSPMFVQPSPSNVTGHFSGQLPSHPNNYQNSFSSTLGMGVSPPPSTMSFPHRATSASESLHPISQSTEDIDDDPQKNEATKLIHYHLENFARNSAYCLPASLRPTLVQRTIPHESVLDAIIHPELRDRMILLREKLDLAECLMEYRRSVTIHGDDVLAHSNWEISEKWLRQYGLLIEQQTLNTVNRWRIERGDPELRLSDIAPSDSTPGAP